MCKCKKVVLTQLFRIGTNENGVILIMNPNGHIFTRANEQQCSHNKHTSACEGCQRSRVTDDRACFRTRAAGAGNLIKLSLRLVFYCPARAHSFPLERSFEARVFDAVLISVHLSTVNPPSKMTSLIMITFTCTNHQHNVIQPSCFRIKPLAMTICVCMRS